MFIDWVGILLLTVPIFLPIMKSLEWGGLFGLPGVRPEDVPLWYGVIFMVNMQMAFLSPPFGYSLFYLEKRRAARNHDGHDFSRGRQLHGAAMARGRALHPISIDRCLAAKRSVCTVGMEAEHYVHY